MADRPEIEYKASPLRRLFWSLALVALLAGAGVALWKSWQLKQAAVIGEAEEAPPQSPSRTESAEKPAAPKTAETNPDEFVARSDTTVRFPPPPATVADSDAWLRGQLPVVDPDPRLQVWLAETGDLLPKLVLLVQEVSQGKVPRRIFAFWAPTEPFQVRAVGEGRYVIDPRSYRRYDVLAQVVEALDVDLAWRLYRRIEPLVDAVFAEYAPPGVRFDDVLLAAVEHLLKTPQPQGEIYLIKPSVMYKYADPGLESLSKAQKQLLRMGPVNAMIVKHKLGLLRGYLLQQRRAEG